MNTKSNKVTKLLSWMLALTMMMTVVLPTSVFAIEPATVTTTLGDNSIIVDAETEFTVTTDPGSVSAMVLGKFEITAEESDITSLEYYATDLNAWATLPVTVEGDKLVGSFGPAATGFPLINATSEFKVTFAEVGDYNVRVSVVEFGTDNVIAYKDVTVTVEESGTISTDIIGKRILVNQAMEFGVSTVANGHAGALVKGKLELVADAADIASLEYYETAPGMEGYHSFPTTVDGNKIVGEFGPATGFPMMDATSKFRITFANEGTYTATVSVYDVASGDEICKQNVIVKAIIPGTVSTDLGSATLFTGDEVEYGVTTVANGDAGTMVKGRFEIEADASDIATLEYFETSGVNEYMTLPTTVVGNKIVGEFGPTTGFPMMDATSKFKIKFANDGDYSAKIFVYNVENDEVLCVDEVAISVINYADYTSLDATILGAAAYNQADYTTVSFNVLKEAIENAKAVDRKLPESDQRIVDDLTKAINDAIAGLIKIKEVTFTAVAVADDASVNYAKANKIVLVFAEPVADGSDILSMLNVADSVENAVWSNDNTVYTLTLKEDHTLKDSATIVFDSDETIMTKLGYAMADTDATVVGNLEEAYEQVTATKMAATIVKASAKPGVQTDDKVVLVFNAPVYGNPTSINVNGKAANVVDNTNNTVYEIKLSTGDSISAPLEYTDGNEKIITALSIFGSFGEAVAPVVLAAVAIDNGGSALTEDDEIIIYFDRPTNGIAVDASKIVKGAVSAIWNDAKTQLTVVLGEGAEVSKVMSINLGGLGIADEYDLAAYVAEDITVKGEFIMPVAPVVYEILAVDNNGNALPTGDQIVVYFDRPTNKTDISNQLNNIAEGKFGTQSHAEWNDAGTILTITLGSDATVTNGMRINLGSLGIKDADETADYVGRDIKVNGEFVTSVAPVITNVIAVDNNGNATTNGDNIIITFDRPTNGLTTLDLSDIIKNSNYGIGDDYSYKWNNDDTELMITLGEYATLTDGLTVNLGNLGIKDEFETTDYVGVDVRINGSFGTTVSPKITRAIAFTQNNKHIVRVFFNTLVTEKPGMSVYIKNFDDDNAEGKWTHNGISYYDMTLGSAHDAFVTDHFEVVFDGTLVDTETQKSAIEDATAIIKGGFEQDIKPEILSLTAYSNDGSGIAKAGDKIVLVFNSAVTSVTTTDKVFTSTDNVTWTYEIKEDNEVKVGDNIKFTVKALGNTTEMNANIGGSFGYKAELKILNLTAYSNSGVGFAKQNDKLILVLNTGATKVSTPGLGEFKQVAGNTTVWEYTVKNDREVNINDHITFNIESNGNTYSDMVAYVGGSFGYKSELKLLSAVAYNEKANGIKSDSEVVLVFNTPVSDVTVSGLGTATKDNDYTWRIKLNANAPGIGENISVVVTDLITGETNKTLSNKLTGSFGYYITPEVIKATAYSKDGSGIAKADDTVIVTFNTPVTNVTVDPTIGVVSQITTDDYINYVITLGVNPTVVVGDELDFTATAIATGETKTIENVKLGGSFGYKVTPEVVSATAYSNDGSGIAKADDIVVVVFNTPVKATVAEAFGTATQMDTYGNVWMITLASNSGAEVGKKFAINATSVATGETVALNPELGGSFGTVVEPKLISATAYSNDGSGIAKVDDKIVLVFNAPVSGVASTLGTVTDVKDSTVWEIALTSTNVAIGDELIFNVTSVANGATKEVKANLGGSFGKVVVPSIKSVTAISNDGSGVAKVGDRIVVVFDAAVRVGAADAETTYVYTYTLTSSDIADGAYAIGTGYSVDVWSVATGAKHTLEATVGGSYGYSEAPAVKSVVLTEAELKEIITVVFDQATTKNSIDTSILYNNNNHLGQTVSAAWTSETVLKITLAADASTNADSKLNLSGLGIKSKTTNIDIDGINELAITGSLIPVATDVRFVNKTIQITFSARTNGVANISNLTALLGTGATASWSDNNRVLTIALGERYTITNNGYIVLNGMGIYDAFSGNYHVVGQYKVLGSIESDKLVVTKIVAQSTDKSVTTAKKGDTIVIKFNSATDLKGAALNQVLASDKVDEIISIGGDNEAALGTGYTGEWTAYDTLVITLGGATTVTEGEGESATTTTTGKDPAITVGTNITVKNVKFANGEGLMDAVPVALSGSFNGREFILTEGAITRTGANNTGDYRIAVKAEDTLLTPSVVPTIVCVAYNGTSPVSVMRISVDVENTIQPVFEFAEGLKITSAKIYVFNELFGDVNSSPSVLAETLEVK